MNSAVAAYCRVSTTGQNEAGQVREIERWLKGNGLTDVQWFIDKQTGDNLDRPAFKLMQAAIFNGEIKTVVCWKLDRLSRSLADGINTLAGWCKAGVRVVSVTQQLDFAGPTGQLVAAVLFAVAAMEQETRRERQAAGIAAAKANGANWGGSSKGRRLTISESQIATAKRLRASDSSLSVSEIARSVGISRRSAYRFLAD